MIWLLACSSPPSGDLIVLHTNDMHGRIEPEKATWLDGDPAIGGLRALGAAVAVHRAQGDVLVLDGGDLASGTPYSELSRGGAIAGAMVEVLGAVGYDAWAVGNHEFDRGIPNLEAMVAHSVAHSAVPALNANVTPPIAGALPSLVVQKGELRVGLVGVVTDELERVVAPTRLGESRGGDIADAVRGEVERLDAVTDLVVVVSHIGVEADQELAAEVAGIDLIVGGHSHTPLREAIQVGDTWIVQAGSYARSLGTVQLRVEDDAITRFEYELVDLVDQPADVPPSVQALYEDLRSEVAAEWEVPIGLSEVEMREGRGVLSDMGLWACARLREAAGTDIAVYNSGGLRAPFFQGPLTRADVYSVFPFDNTVATFELSGADVEVLAGLAGGDIQYQGFSRVPVTVGGEALDETRTYTVATNSFMFERWSGFVPGTTPLNGQLREETVREVMEGAVRAGPVRHEAPTVAPDAAP